MLKKHLNQQKNVSFFPPFSLNTIMFLDGYKSKVISFQMLSKTRFIREYDQYIIVQKKSVGGFQ